MPFVGGLAWMTDYLDLDTLGGPRHVYTLTSLKHSVGREHSSLVLVKRE